MARVVLLAALAVPFATAVPAGAATFRFTLETTSPVTLPGVTLTAADQTASFSIVTQVQYTGGNNRAGWKVEASATTPTASGGATLPALTVADGSFACASKCTTDPSPTGIGYPITLSGTAQTIYNADAGTGRGTFTITSTCVVSYPGNARAGIYSSTITLAGSTGP